MAPSSPLSASDGRPSPQARRVPLQRSPTKTFSPTFTLGDSSPSSSPSSSFYSFFSSPMTLDSLALPSESDSPASPRAVPASGSGRRGGGARHSSPDTSSDSLPTMDKLSPRILRARGSFVSLPELCLDVAQASFGPARAQTNVGGGHRHDAAQGHAESDASGHRASPSEPSEIGRVGLGVGCEELQSGGLQLTLEPQHFDSRSVVVVVVVARPLTSASSPTLTSSICSAPISSPTAASPTRTSRPTTRPRRVAHLCGPTSTPTRTCPESST